MKKYELFALVEGDPFLSRVKRYRKEKEDSQQAWYDFGKKIGAKHWVVGVGFAFEGRVPSGWNAAQGRHKISTPKKKSVIFENFNALPKQPMPYDHFKNDFIYDVSYEGDSEKGSFGIGNFWLGPQVCWAGEKFFLVIPDARQAAHDHLSIHPNHKIKNGSDTWELPAGLKKITEAEADLIVAQYRVDKQKGKIK